jgi:thiamine biosynthesis lipoprotein
MLPNFWEAGSMNKKLLIGMICVLALGGFSWFKAQSVADPSWAQATMGTECHITLAGSVPKRDLAALRKKIDTALADVNHCMSTWQADTEISKFNAFQSLEPFPISPAFAEVMQSALAFSAATDGAFDPTVKPLVDHWGFGPAADEESLAEIMEAVGWQKVRLENNTLIKDHPELELDLSAIAKGYGVDCVAEVIRASGHPDFIVEIGGEIVAGGTNPSAKLWRIGIESPEPGRAFGEKIFQTVEISNKAMATSGDYRNFRVRSDGTRYSHIIDPHTGKPAMSDVAAVTVIAARCMDADAVATSLCVMGSEKGFQWLENHPEFQALFILHSNDGNTFTSKATAGFPVSEKQNRIGK